MNEVENKSGGDKKFSKLWTKLKGVKHIELYIAGAIAIVIILIYLSTMFGGKTDPNSNLTNLNISEYATYLENKLSSVLSNINGAGRVSVMVTLESGTEIEYAYTEETKTNVSNGLETTTTTKEPVIVTNQGQTGPIIIKEYLPKVNGVLIVAGGAKDVAVKLELLKAAQAILNVPTTNIEILVGNN